MEKESLEKIAEKYFLDKSISTGYHNYIPAYSELFDPIRNQIKNVLEIGIGSVENKQMTHVVSRGYQTGNSLKAWAEYFENAQIYGIDIYEHQELNTDRIHTFVADQSDNNHLECIVKEIGEPLEIVIDDGSHQPGHQANSFKYLSKYMAPGGIYAIEDIQSPYISAFKDLSIFSPEFREYILQNFEVKYFDSRDKGMPDDFITAFIKK